MAEPLEKLYDAAPDGVKVNDDPGHTVPLFTAITGILKTVMVTTAALADWQPALIPHTE